MLTRLSGRTHRVITAVAVARGSTRTDALVNVSRVTFSRIARTELQSYVASGEPMDKAGAYGIQGEGVGLVRWVEGSYTNVVGLPLVETLELLRGAGIR